MPEPASARAAAEQAVTPGSNGTAQNNQNDPEDDLTLDQLYDTDDDEHDG